MKSFITLAALLPFMASAAPAAEAAAALPKSINVSNFMAATNEGGKANGMRVAFNAEIPGVLKTECVYTDTTTDDRFPKFIPENGMQACANPLVQFRLVRPRDMGCKTCGINQTYFVLQYGKGAEYQQAMKDINGSQIASYWSDDEDEEEMPIYETKYIGRTSFTVDFQKK